MVCEKNTKTIVAGTKILYDIFILNNISITIIGVLYIKHCNYRQKVKYDNGI